MRCRPSRAIARVDLPEPDSPTIPSVSPCRTDTLTCFTAVKRPLRNHPARPGNFCRKPTVTSRASSITGAIGSTGAAVRCGRLFSSLRV